MATETSVKKFLSPRNRLVRVWVHRTDTGGPSPWIAQEGGGGMHIQQKRKDQEAMFYPEGQFLSLSLGRMCSDGKD